MSKMKRKSTKVIDGYTLKRQLHGKYKVVAHYHDTNECIPRKRTLYKDLLLTDAESIIYFLEKNTLKQ